MRKIAFLFSAFLILPIQNLWADSITLAGAFTLCEKNRDSQAENCTYVGLAGLTIDLASDGHGEWTSPVMDQNGYWTQAFVKVKTLDSSGKLGFSISCVTPNSNPMTTPAIPPLPFGEAFTAVDSVESLNLLGVRCGAADFTRDDQNYGVEASFILFPSAYFLKLGDTIKFPGLNR